MPPGFVRVAANGRSAMCPADQADWVTAVLKTAPPATRPTTMPADLLTALQAKKGALAKQLSDDLALPDNSEAMQQLDKLESELSALKHVRPPLLFFVAREDQVLALLKGGWSNPRFYYNRAENAVEVEQGIPFREDAPMDEVLIPVHVDAADGPDQKKQRLSQMVPQIEQDILTNIASHARLVAYGAVAQLGAKQRFEPMNLPRDQKWIGLGITNYLALLSLHELGGGDLDQLVAAASTPPDNWPFPQASLDLLHPLADSDLNPDYRRMYNDALGWKATAVVAKWVKQAGESAIGKTLSALQGKPAADAGSLVKLIQQQTGVDLSSQLAAH